MVVKLIDFAHCYEIKDIGGKDYSFLHGVYFLLASLNEILDRSRRIGRRSSILTLKKQQAEEDKEIVKKKEEEVIESDEDVQLEEEEEQEEEEEEEIKEEEKKQDTSLSDISPIKNKLSRRSLSMIDVLEQGKTNKQRKKD